MGVWEQFPYSDLSRLNLDWVLRKIDEVSKLLEEFSDYTDAANSYTDKKISETLRYIDSEIVKAKNELISYTDMKSGELSEKIGNTNALILETEERLITRIDGVVATTELLIKANNEYILNVLGESLADIKVTNYFTGEKITIQAMFDILAQLHTENAITYQVLIDRNKTYTELADLDFTYAELAVNGNNIIT